MEKRGLSRVRTRNTPLPMGGARVVLGYLESRNLVYHNGVPEWGPWGAWRSDDIYYDPWNPWLSAKTTMDEVHPGPPYRSGGPFKSITRVNYDAYNRVIAKGVYDNWYSNLRYVGGFMPPVEAAFGSSALFPTIPVIPSDSPLFADLNPLGQRAWKLTRPKLEQASAFVFLAEARDMPRMLQTTSAAFHDSWKAVGGDLRSTVMQPKKTADQYLNVQFGWKPFLNDLAGFDRVTRNVNTLIGKFTKENGQWVRRRSTLVDESNTTLLASGTWPWADSFPIQVFPVNFRAEFFTAPPSWTLHESIQTHARAIGKFRYYRPEFDKLNEYYYSVWSQVMRNLTLYGLRISPSNIYKATPWSWLIDWFTSFGDRIDHLTDIWLDSMAAKYLYVTHHQVKVRRFTINLPLWNLSAGLTPLSLEFSRTVETKQRGEGASPFDYSLSWNNLNSKQLSILGALGISRKG